MSAYKCNLVVPGFGKSGTSSLHEYLASHPNIEMSKPKEPHFFSIEEQWSRGPAFHNALFSPTAGAQPIYFGESSTTYAASDVALHRIKDCLSDPRLVFLVRDPVDRVISHYRWMYALGLEKRPVLEAIEQDGFGFDPNHSVDGNYMAYLQLSSYSRYLPQWLDTFGQRNVLVLFSEDLARKPLEVANHCFRFLQLEPLENMRTIRENVTRDATVRNVLGNIFSRLVPKPIKKRVARDPRVMSAWRAAAHRKTTIQPPDVDPSDARRIAALLGKEVTYFNLLRRDFGLLN